MKFRDYINESKPNLQDVVKYVSKLSIVNTAEIEKVSGGEYVSIKVKNSTDLSTLENTLKKKFKAPMYDMEKEGLSHINVYLNKDMI